MEAPINRFILSFHMPLFFFLSGYLFTSGDNGFISFFQKKIRVLLFPHIILFILGTAWEVFKIFFNHQPLTNYGSLFVTLFSWFLPVMFLCCITFKVLASLISLNERVNQIITLIFIAIAILVMQLANIHTPASGKTIIAIFPMALLFFYAGYILKITKKVDLTNNKKHFLYCIPCIPLLILISFVNEPIGMYLNEYGNILLFILGAFTGILFVVELSKKTENNILLKYVGKNSIIIFVLHFSIINVLRVVIARICVDIDSFWQSWIIFTAAIILLFPLVVFCNKYMGFMFGIRKINRRVET